MIIKPIQNENDYEEALAEIERLFDAEPDSPECDKLDVLVTLVSAYEDKHYDLPPPDPIDALEYYIESRHLTDEALEPYIGAKEDVRAILTRTQPLTLPMIRRLEVGTGIPASILIQPYEVEVNLFVEETTKVRIPWRDWLAKQDEIILPVLKNYSGIDAEALWRFVRNDLERRHDELILEF
ncbi:MAG: hypothetical protein AAF639_04530 [Chloroflexota bacterium]